MDFFQYRKTSSKVPMCFLSFFAFTLGRLLGVFLTFLTVLILLRCVNLQHILVFFSAGSSFLLATA